MTYLQLVNGVLTRMREDTVDTLSGNDDVVVQIVKDLVNDAKRLVEDSHDWNELLTTWAITTADNTATYSLTGSQERVNIDYIIGPNGQHLVERTRQDLHTAQAYSTDKAQPTWYAVNGVDGNRDKQLLLNPTPDGVYNFTVYGRKSQTELAGDSDVLLIPAKPVLYYALAYAARERGEVGGQTAAELFAMAQMYLSDAIAHDSSLQQLDHIWMTV